MVVVDVLVGGMVSTVEVYRREGGVMRVAEPMSEDRVKGKGVSMLAVGREVGGWGGRWDVNWPSMEIRSTVGVS